MNIAILGASDKPDRYAYRAQRLLAEHGHRVFPISPSGKDVLGESGYRSILDLPGDQAIDTLTLYINPARLDPLIDDIITAKPGRVIFNPGTESAEAEKRFRAAGIAVLDACTLVLLQTDQF
jgi:predicted CoA-binding protein